MGRKLWIPNQEEVWKYTRMSLGFNFMAETFWMVPSKEKTERYMSIDRHFVLRHNISQIALTSLTFRLPYWNRTKNTIVFADTVFQPQNRLVVLHFKDAHEKHCNDSKKCRDKFIPTFKITKLTT